MTQIKPLPSQTTPRFADIATFFRLPVIKDLSNNEIIFESGAILIYLGEKSNKFYDTEERLVIKQWLMGCIYLN